MRLSLQFFLLSLASLSVPGESVIYDDFFNYDDAFGVTITHSPTASPTIAPSPIPSPEPCQVSKSGEFGSTDNEQSEIVPYSYQVNYKTNGNIKKIVGDLETAISNSIVSKTSLFEGCGSNAKSSGLSVVGLSSLPKDTVSSEQCSISTASSESACAVVKGSLSLFYGGGSSRRHLNESDEVARVIKESIADGSLQNANKDVLELGYIDQDDTKNSIDKQIPDSQKPPTNESLGSSNIGIILVAACGTLALLVLTAWKYKKARALSNHDDFYDDDVFDETSVEDPVPNYQFIERRRRVADLEPMEFEEEITPRHEPEASRPTTGQINHNDRYSIYPNPYMSYSEHIKSDEVNFVFENGVFKNKPSKSSRSKNVPAVPIESRETFEDNNLKVLHDISLERTNSSAANSISTPIGCRFAENMCPAAAVSMDEQSVLSNAIPFDEDVMV